MGDRSANQDLGEEEQCHDEKELESGSLAVRDNARYKLWVDVATSTLPTQKIEAAHNE